MDASTKENAWNRVYFFTKLILIFVLSKKKKKVFHEKLIQIRKTGWIYTIMLIIWPEKPRGMS